MTTRRGFFKLMAGAAAMAAVPSIAITKAVPVIFCNGVDCDSAGLDALIRGEVVEFANPDLAAHIGWRGDVLQLAGDFTVKEPVKLPKANTSKTLTGGKFTFYGDGFDLTGARGWHITKNMLSFDDSAPKGSRMVFSNNWAMGVA